MGNVAVPRCNWCKRELGVWEGYWQWHSRVGLGERKWCMDCVQPIAPIADPKAPLLPPAGWGPEPNPTARPKRRSEVNPPKG